jgi:uncharacterized protein YkwD
MRPYQMLAAGLEAIRPYRMMAAGLSAVVLGVLAVASVVLAFEVDGDGRQSDVLGALQRPTETWTPTNSPSPTPTATASPTPLPPPTNTPVPPPPPPPQAVAPAPAAPARPAAAAPAPPDPGNGWYDTQFSLQVQAIVNAERAARGLSRLSSQGNLQTSAARYAKVLLDLGALSHTADGTSMQQRIEGAGYSAGPPYGEVLWSSSGFLPPETTVANWLNSPSHRDVLLSPMFSLAGTSCYFVQGARLEARCVMDLAG